MSQTGVAHFPWDPKPEQVASPSLSTPTTSAPIQTQTQTTSNYSNAITTPAPPQPQQQQAPQFAGNSNGVTIKQEPGAEAQAPISYPPPAAFNTAQSAQERAALNLQHQYGQRAAASISAIHGTVPVMQQQQRPMQMPMSQQQTQNGQQMQNGLQIQNHQQQQQPQQQGQQNLNMNAQQAQQLYRQRMAQQAAAQQQAAQMMKNNNIGGQTDGADEIQPGSIGILTRMNAQGEEVEMGRIEIDHMIRRRIEAMGQSMEGGGLMRPLGRQVPASRPKKRRAENAGTSALAPAGTSSGNTTVPVPQYDGLDDDDVKDEDEKDEDAINSDLDDPEEKDMDDDDEDEGANTMLCMYDKVQRVKNKWFVSPYLGL